MTLRIAFPHKLVCRVTLRDGTALTGVMHRDRNALLPYILKAADGVTWSWTRLGAFHTGGSLSRLDILKVEAVKNAA